MLCGLERQRSCYGAMCTVIVHQHNPLGCTVGAFRPQAAPRAAVTFPFLTQLWLASVALGSGRGISQIFAVAVLAVQVY